MSSGKAVTATIRHVKPILSVDRNECRRRVISLYRAWYRQIPIALILYDIPKSIDQCRAKVKEEFLKHKDVKDIRVIDILVIKGQMDLKEVAEVWKQRGHLMDHWKDTIEPKPKDFLSKFMSGIN